MLKMCQYLVTDKLADLLIKLSENKKCQLLKLAFFVLFILILITC